MIEPLLSGYLKRVKRKISSSLGSLAEDGIEFFYNEFLFSGLETRKDLFTFFLLIALRPLNLSTPATEHE